MTIKFDRKVCSRCHGTGQYSYCQMHGTTCFGCGGTGQQLTKRGKAQVEAYRASLERPASEVQVGEFIKIWPSNKWRKVLKVETGENYVGLWTSESVNDRLNCKPTDEIESIKSEMHRRELVAAAINGVAA